MGASPHSPTVRHNTKTLHTFGKNTYICGTQRQPAERYGRVANKSRWSELTDYPTSPAAFFFLSYWYDYKVPFFGWSTLCICTQAQMPATRAARPNTDKNTINSTIPLFKFLRQLYIPPPSPKGEAHKDKPCLRSMECYLASNILFTEHLLKHFP
jgi:hypothetical protein